MAILYLDRRDLELRADGERLALYEGGVRASAIPAAQVERVVVSARARLDTGVLGMLAMHGAGISVFSPRHPERAVRLVGTGHNDAGRRIAQYARSLDDGWRARVSAVLITAKIRGQRRLLKSALERRPDLRHDLFTAIGSVEERAIALRTGAPDRDRIRGIEGAAAAAYFTAYQTLFPPALGFYGRNRRPPKDPVNACLSLGYTLLHGEAVFAMHAAGLDPLIGVYHDLAFGRESGACDLVEPLRPVVDGWVWIMFRERRLRAEDFTEDKGACLLGKSGRQAFYRAFEEECLNTLRRRLRRFAAALVRAIGRPPVPAEAVS